MQNLKFFLKNILSSSGIRKKICLLLNCKGKKKNNRKKYNLFGNKKVYDKKSFVPEIHISYLKLQNTFSVEYKHKQAFTGKEF